MELANRSLLRKGDKRLTSNHRRMAFYVPKFMEGHFLDSPRSFLNSTIYKLIGNVGEEHISYLAWECKFIPHPLQKATYVETFQKTSL